MTTNNGNGSGKTGMAWFIWEIDPFTKEGRASHSMVIRRPTCCRSFKIVFPCFAKFAKPEPFKHPQEDKVQDILNKEREKKMKAAPKKKRAGQRKEIGRDIWDRLIKTFSAPIIYEFFKRAA